MALRLRLLITSILALAAFLLYPYYKTGINGYEQHIENYEQHNDTYDQRIEERAFGRSTMAADLFWPFVERGRDHLQSRLEADLECFANRMTEQFGPDPSFGSLNGAWQRPPSNVWTGTGAAAWSWTPLDGVATWPAIWASQSRAVGALQVGVNPPIDGQRWTVRRNVLTTFAPAGGPNMAINDLQNMPWTHANVQHPATNARYQMVINILDGVIVIEAALSPMNAWLQAHPGFGELDVFDLPNMQRLSDRMWWHWRRLHYEAGPMNGRIPGSGTLDYTRMIPGVRLTRTSFEETGQMRTFLNWIVITSIGGEDTGKIVSNCLLARSFDPANPGPLWERRQTFPAGHWCFYALLATSDNSDVFWFLAHHKFRGGLGHKALKSVTIFFTDANPAMAGAATVPSLIWEVVDYDWGLAIDKLYYETLWVHGQAAPPNIPYARI